MHKQQFILIFDWVVKLISVGFLGLVTFLVGAHVLDGFTNTVHLTSIECQLAIAMSLLFLGALIGLKWRLIGGVVSILTFIAFAIIEQRLILGFVLNAFLLIGVANMILFWLKKRV